MCFEYCGNSICGGRCVFSTYVHSFFGLSCFYVFKSGSPPCLCRLPICVTLCVSHCVCHIVCVTLCVCHIVCVTLYVTHFVYHILYITFCNKCVNVGKGPIVTPVSTCASTVRLMAVPLAKTRLMNNGNDDIQLAVFLFLLPFHGLIVRL